MGYNFDWVVLENHENVVWLKVNVWRLQQNPQQNYPEQALRNSRTFQNF